MTTFSPDIAEKIRNLVIFEGLELEELGIELDDIKDDTLLYDADGLDLDSIDALEVLAGVQREFGVTFPEIDSDFIADHASTVGKLAASVSLQMNKAVAA
jgi:acyl carrier protein